ncbi:DUF5667 domain-containing protein [Clostridium folliculivorans]|uniref:DUF5667 domain-containing protein n=1 Tax=Clostridium folliculivorans TaxID=2886038 RepID=A0A9W5Y410_9CLOT|nr:DUF5667 domain-containing protein [Clostridium folliculivorans]GKU26108.1 hypothetical protein CFOLD11_29350 [Clostridium folliculivorans]GKU28194.1 hypothetical protein CFB3_03000 [Clostridium folliculivorans]
MKKKYVLALSLMFSLSFSVPAFAADTTTNKTTDYKSYAGLTPNSIFYPLDKAIENIQLRFTKDPNKKIEKLLEIQKERLGEIQTLVEKDKKNLVPIALEGLEYATSQTQTETAKIITDTNVSKPITDSDTTTSDNTTTAGSTSELDKEIAAIDSTTKSIENTNTDSIEILDSIKDQLPQEEQDKLSAVVEMQKQKKEAVKQMVSAIHDLNTARKQVNEANKALKDATKSGDSSAIAKAQETLNVANEAFTQKQTALETAKANKQLVVHQAKVGKGSDATSKEPNSDDKVTTEPSTESESSNSSANTEGSSNVAIGSTSATQAPTAAAKKTTNTKESSTTEVKKKEDSEKKVSSEKKETKDSDQEVKKTEHSNEKDKNREDN